MNHKNNYSNTKLKIVQIGINKWNENYANTLKKLNVLTALCDINEENAKLYGKKYFVNYYNSVDSLLSSEEFDVAFVCTPTSTYNEIVSKLIHAKKHVFVEHSLTHISKDRTMLFKMAKKNNILLSCNYIERFNPVILLVKNFIQSKKFGDLVMLEFHRGEKKRDEIPLNTHNTRIIHDTLIPNIDIAMWLLDNNTPQIIFAKTGKINHEYEDFVTLLLGFKGDKVTMISSNWISPTNVGTFNIVFTNATLTGDFINQVIKIEKSDCTEIPRFEHEDPLQNEIKNFLGAINGRNDLIVKPEQAINVAKVAEAITLSAQKGVPIYLESL